MKDVMFQSPTKLFFGVGRSAEIGAICLSYHATKIFVVTDRQIASLPEFQQILDSITQSGLSCMVYADTVPEPPIEVVDQAAGMLKESGADLVVAVGGGSPIDTAKSIAMLATNTGSVREYLFGGTRTVEQTPLPLLCVPTTAGSGSEVTAASVITDQQHHIKLSVTDEKLIPKAAIIDPMMQKGMPMHITASTGMDALTHAIEAYMSLNASPFSDSYAETATRLIGENLYTATYNPENMEARGNMAMASVMAAQAFVNAGLGAVHGISQAMGGVAHVAHGVANAMMLPLVMEKNYVGNLKKAAKIASLLGGRFGCGTPLREQARTCVEILAQFAEDLRIPRTLKEVGVTQEMFPEIVRGTMGYRLLAVNPVKITEQDVYDILQKAM